MIFIQEYDFVVIGAGIYGLYASKLLAARGLRVLVIECEDKPFTRASFVNQARVHYGYHYPRSFSTAIKSAGYFKRFCKDFDFAINRRFEKIYAISSKYSLTSGDQFVKFCRHADIPCDEINPDRYFNHNSVQAAFETLEYSFDAEKIGQYLTSLLERDENVTLMQKTHIVKVDKDDETYSLTLNNGQVVQTQTVLNSTYASVNQINDLFGLEKFMIKYEIAEVIQCTVSPNIQNVGLTVMDGPFFSVMPFGDSGLHTLTSVTFTPHITSYQNLPTFECQKKNQECTDHFLQNCNICPAKPKTAWPYMHQMAKKYLIPAAEIHYNRSLFAIKPILQASEIDDSRPTLIKTLSDKPRFISILSGKINTIYDLEKEII